MSTECVGRKETVHTDQEELRSVHVVRRVEAVRSRSASYFASLSPELPARPGIVTRGPALDDLPVGKTEHLYRRRSNALAGGWHAHVTDCVGRRRRVRDSP